MNHQTLLYCRPGFEKELAAEAMHIATDRGYAAYCKTHENVGIVSVFSEQPLNLRLAQIIFARQMIDHVQRLDQLPESDRISPILEALEHILPEKKFRDIVLESPDTNEGKALSRFLKKFIHPLAKTLKGGGYKKSSDPKIPYIHLCFVNYEKAYLGLNFEENRSPFPGGIRRLKFPKDGPSRSTLKLEEAFLEFWANPSLGSEQSNLVAVDLGAAPGGWTYQLIKRGMFNYAVDNGPMNEELMNTGLVEHCREDAYKFHPRGPVDLLVCDMVDKPLAVSKLILSWFEKGWCKHAIFNLKLPMKKRFEEVMTCLNLLRGGPISTLKAKHLYHDREEITCYASSPSIIE